MIKSVLINANRLRTICYIVVVVVVVAVFTSQSVLLHDDDLFVGTEAYVGLVGFLPTMDRHVVVDV